MLAEPLLKVLSRGVPLTDEVHVVDGVEVRSRRVPAPGAVPVVCVHGMVVTSRYFVPTVRELAGHVDVWAPTLPDFGTSGRTGQPMTVSSLADRLVRWMEVADTGPAVLLANSFGCQFAVEAAVRYPNAVRALVLNGPTTDPAARDPLSQMVRWLWTGRAESVLQTPILVQDYLEFGPWRVPTAMSAVLDDAIEDKLPFVQQPSVVVVG
jgi:pimeloyl-ACP methyl ester carboxylesterase